MIKIAICDDEKQQRSILKAIVSTQLQLLAMEYTILEFDSGESFFSSNRNVNYDIIFLDIEMKAMDGIETAKKIRLSDKNAIIIFVTAYTDYVFQGYEVRALNYILKPYRKDKITEVLKVALEELAISQNQYYAIESKAGTYRLNLPETLYLLSDKRFIHAITLSETIDFYGKLDDLEKVFPPHFVRIHQRYLVNTSYINAIEGNEVYIKDERLPISRAHKQELLIRFAKTMLR
ncbi:MAG TPA: LytTR family DNA-binding domain-containing protein [Lachnospiraceae bacterium]|nr:LytTR family DNA-binding domain-containing protein [Lachnospiraceae bacterium]